ncbi:cytochrome P450 [Cellulosimicrobium terreum]|nr:cytochrome P450 [Cellulosimicrobium terreum]
MRWEERVQRGAHPLVYPAIRGLRRIGPVVRVPGIGVVVSDAATAREVLLDTERFTKVGPGSPSDLWTPVLGPSVLLNMEGVDHARLRRALSGLFTPRAVRELVAASVPDVLAGLAPRLLAGERVDLVAETATMAGTVICAMTGLPPTDAAVRDAMTAAQSVVGMVRLHRRSLTTTQVAHARAVLARLSEPARDAYRDGDPATVPGRMRELGLTEAEAMGAVGAFVLTGTETIQSFVPRLVALTADTGWLDRLLAADPQAQGDAGREAAARRSRVVEEALRVTAPTPAMLRAVRTEASVGDVPVHPGDRVVVATVSCCKDAGPFDPDTPVGPAVRNLWFGAGPHFCLGMPLAMAQVDAVLDALRPVAVAGRTLRVVDRATSRGVLIPAYRSLVVQAG